jgi:hypothetical protein
VCERKKSRKKRKGEKKKERREERKKRGKKKGGYKCTNLRIAKADSELSAFKLSKCKFGGRFSVNSTISSKLENLFFFLSSLLFVLSFSLSYLWILSQK